MNIAALVETLLAAGVDHATVVAAVKAVEPKIEDRAERKRAADRERIAMKRELSRESQMSRDIATNSTPSLDVSKGSPAPLPNLPNPFPKKTPKGVQKGVSPQAFNPRKALLDLGCEEKHIDGWLAARKAKRAPLTEAALDALKREANRANISPAYAVQLCAERGWQSFQADWKFDRPASGSDPPGVVKQVFVPEDSDAFRAWCDYRRRIGGSRPYVTESREHGFKRGHWFPTEWPPKVEMTA